KNNYLLLAAKKLLIIGFVWPEPKSSAAGSRMMQLIETFQGQNYQITFASACAKTENAFNLETIGIEQITIELNNSSFDAFINKLHPDIVVFDRFMTEEQFGWRVDRKSTRLNSSHVKISYAVFCLKKKKKK